MLGMQCRVFWPLKQQWFNGVVTRYNRVKNKHRIEYDDGDHEWLCFHAEGSRIQLFNGYCWCMASMFEPALRTLRATMFLTLRFQQYDPRFLGWRSGVMKAYNEQNGHFLVSYDDFGYGVMEEWVDAFRQEQLFQVQDMITLEWYSLSGYVFGRIRGRPLSMAAGKAATGYYCGVEDYLSYVEEVPVPESEVAVDANPGEIIETGEDGSDQQLIAENEFIEEVKGDNDDEDGDDSGGSSDGGGDGDDDGGQDDEEEDEEDGDEDDDEGD